MNVTIVGSKEFDSLEFHLADELTHQGNTVRIEDYRRLLPARFDWAFTMASSKYEKFKNDALLDKVTGARPDLVIVVYRHVQPFVIREIKRQGIKVIHVNPDALTTFQGQQLFAEKYDHYFTKDPYIRDFMRGKLNLNAHLYQEAFNPRFHDFEVSDFAKLEAETAIDVLTFGNLYPYRNRMLSELKSAGIDVAMFGHKARYFDADLEANFRNKAIYGAEKSRLLNGAKIVFNNFHYAEIESVNNKFFEITGAGAFQICDYKPILHELLPIDPKKISFGTIAEAKELIRFYLNEPEARWETRKTLKQHFQQHFTYANMVQSILEKI